jgi:hypothetical protein
VDEARLIRSIESLVGPDLAKALVGQFIKIRRDYATKTLERAAPGKFVEIFVQCLQQMATGAHELTPSVDDYLLRRVENETVLPEGLRVCAARIARSMYALRRKRNIAHNNQVDPNTADLGFVHQAAAWILAELIRTASGITMEEAGTLISLVQAPVGSLVEEIDGMRLVHADVSVREEVLILMHSVYPNRLALQDLLRSMGSRSPGGIRNQLATLRTEKLIVGDTKTGYLLTQAGHAAATKIIRRLPTAA